MQPTFQVMVELLITLVELVPIMVEVVPHNKQHLGHHSHNKRCLQIMSVTDVSNLDITSEIARRMTIQRSTPFKERVYRENISGSVILELMLKSFLITNLKFSGKL